MATQTVDPNAQAPQQQEDERPKTLADHVQRTYTAFEDVGDGVMVAQEVTNRITVFRTDTGAMITLDPDPENLKIYAAMKNRQGLPLYSMIPVPVPKGSIKCILHADNPDRGEYNRLGFANCRKGGFRDIFTMEIHVKNRHEREWAVLEDIKKREREDEALALQRATLQQAQAMTALVQGSMGLGAQPPEPATAQKK